MANEPRPTPMQQRWGYSTIKAQPGQVWVGESYGADDGSYSGFSGQVPIARQRFYDTGAVKSNYGLISGEARAQLQAQANHKNGWSRDVPDTYVASHYEDMVDLAQQIQTQYGARVGPLDAYDWYMQNVGKKYGSSGGKDGSGSGGGGGGGGGGVSSSTSVSTSVNLTDPGTARGLIDDALAQAIGRKATVKEQQMFMKALTGQENKNPSTTTTQSTSVSGGGSSSTVSKSKTKGGFNASQFAEEFAAADPEAGEFKAATSLLDQFISTISRPKVEVV